MAYVDSDDESNTKSKLTGNNTQIQVYARIKPSTKNNTTAYTIDETELCVKHDSVKLNDYINNTQAEYNYKFAHILDTTTTQSQVFDCIAKPVVDNVLQGYNGTIFAYGQTGSGKTYTITGGTNSYDERGIIPRTLDYIYKYVSTEQAKSRVQYTVKISYMEIYNENGYDLLHPEHNSTKLDDLPKITVYEKNNEFIPSNIYTFQANTLDEALNLLFVGDTNRIICETPSNDVSTRSHCIFTIFIESKHLDQNTVKYSKLNLVDLAGSERIKKTGVTGKIQQEARYINLSLHYLEQLIIALHNVSIGKSTYLPYRNSMMTMMLRDSLGGNCMTTMIATMSMQEQHLDETISTARFAQRVALISNNVSINESIDTTQLIKSLKLRVKQQNEIIAVLKGQQLNNILSETDIENCKTLIQQYISDTNNTVTLHLQSQSKIEKCFELMRSIILLQQGSTGINNTNSNQLLNNDVSTILNNTNGIHNELTKLKLQLQQKDKEISVLVQMLKNNDKTDSTVLIQQQTQHLQALNNTNVNTGIDTAELNERAKLFEQFRKSYRKNELIEENKLLLQKKYIQAKQLGEQINQCRNTINTLKSTLEQNRIQRSVSTLTDGITIAVQDNDSDSDIIQQIDDNKQLYKNKFVELKALKQEIEHDQSILEQSRRQLQADFDLFWAQQQNSNGTTNHSNTTHTITDITNTRPNSSRNSTNKFNTVQHPVTDTALQSSKPTVPTIQPVQPVPTKTYTPVTSNTVIKSVQQYIPSTTLPSTGNSQADADIAAFYRMRDQLLAQQRRT